MRAGPIGGVEVPVIGMGTWAIERDDRAGAVRALRAGLDAGARHIDTAEMYGSGRAEEVVAEAIDGRRDEVFLVSKVLPDNASRAGVHRACEASLRRLRTDRLDCYLLHWPGRHPLEETLGAFEELRAQGKVLSYGVSNFDADLLEDAVRIAGPGRIACDQVLYHLGERYPERRLLAACRRLGLALVGYSPFASGPFTSSPVLDDIARAHGATARQVALAFLVRLPGTFAIPKSGNAGRVRENAAAAGLVLSAEDVARLDAAFPVRDAGELPTL